MKGLYLLKCCCKWVLLLSTFFGFSGVGAKEITVGFHHSAPWAYLDKNGLLVGINPEIIKAAFSGSNYQLNFKIYGYSRLVSQLKFDRIDFASPVAFNIDNAYLTDQYLPFQNVAISLLEKQFNIEQLADLKGKRIVAFQQASRIYGKEFEQLVSAEKDKYTELVKRDVQIKMLFMGRADVVVGEQRILLMISDALYNKQQLAIHNILPFKVYGGVSKDKAIVEAFNQGLKRIRANGIYQQILDKKRVYTAN